MKDKKIAIVDTLSAEYYTWGANCDSWVLVDTKGLSVKQERMPSGAKERKHFHAKAQQFFYILKGTATFYIDHHRIDVVEEKGIVIHPDTAHFIANETDRILEFLVISQPTTTDDRTVVE